MSRKRLDHEQIIQQAQEIVYNDGVVALTFQRLSKDLDIRSQSLYNYFKNLDDLVEQLGARFLEDLYQQLIEGLIGLSGKAAFQKYADIAHTYFESQHRSVELLYQVHTYGTKSEFYLAMAKILDLLNTLVHSVTLKTMDEDAYVQTLISSVFGFIVLEIMGFLPTDEKKRHEQFRQLLELQLSEIKTN
ncbi:TetR/AcrR family transcriptional regulator [Agrilactobacillus yilanensis]|uniref:TetR/AcrR family transcriptional regulator n=1 Tax=Agrilactobacillus yilanensis TaxID=2485997 RepID=A0ABW4J9H2_9LACO|nr:TetR/AcrR family transcriptional regulator [Agrilactobacillus yilanensis]